MKIEEAVDLILAQRGFSGEAPLSSFPPPSAFPGCVEAGEIMAEALISGKRICVWGDYDTDGITASAVMSRFLRETIALNGFSASAGCFLPNRFKDGYGVNASRMPEIAENYDLMITVDCGVTAFSAIEKASALGLQVVVTDHHLPEAKLPKASAICDPALLPEGERDNMALAGVGVAFTVIRACQLCLSAKGYATPDIRKYLSYVAMGTVVDVAPVSGASRILVKAGMKMLERGRDVWVAAMKKAVGMKRDDFIDSEAMGFKFGPMINAAGRMNDASLSLELLLSDNPDEAFKKALALSDVNKDRRRKQGHVQDEAMKLAKDMEGAGLVLVGDWHPGVIGIAAAKVAQSFGKPVLLCSNGKNGGVCRGSGRTAGNVSLYKALSMCPSLLTFGGHDAAGGVSFRLEDLKTLRAEFSKACEACVMPVIERECAWDADVNMADINLDNIGCLRKLEPLGNGNPKPVFRSEPLALLDFDYSPMRLKMRLSGKNGKYSAIAWQPDKCPEDSDIGKIGRFFYYPYISEFFDKKSIEFNVDNWTFN